MAVIVRDRQTDQSYILIGTGYGMYSSSRPAAYFGEFGTVEAEGEKEMVAVCDQLGRISWLESTRIYVESVDGVSPANLLNRDYDEELRRQNLLSDGDIATDADIQDFLDDEHSAS